MGFLRLFLALSVVAGHSQTSVFGFHGVGAWYAVNFFFIISGFYMAMVLNEKYRDTYPLQFYKSRALRIFPTYYIGLLLMFFVSYEGIIKFFDQLSDGAKFYYIFQNLFIFGQDLSNLVCSSTTSGSCANAVEMTINPAAWSLAVELCFYLVAPFILKSVKRTYVFMLIGCGYLLLLNVFKFPLDFIVHPTHINSFNYYFYPSSFLFFGGGALAYHLSKSQHEPNYLLAILTVVALAFVETIMPFWHLLLVSLAIPVLFKYTAKNPLDRTIGELSYPAYILHFPVLLFIRPLTKTHPEYFDFIGLGSWVAIVSCFLGLLIYFFIEKKINLYREAQTSVKPSDSTKVSVVSFTVPVSLFIYFVIPFAVVGYLYSEQTLATQRPSLRPFDLTDENWVRGLSRKEAAFFVVNSPLNIEHYKTGRQVKFHDGEVRKIIRVMNSGMYLNIYLDGSPLDGEKLGFPRKIELAEAD